MAQAMFGRDWATQNHHTVFFQGEDALQQALAARVARPQTNHSQNGWVVWREADGDEWKYLDGVVVSPYEAKNQEDLNSTWSRYTLSNSGNS